MKKNVRSGFAEKVSEFLAAGHPACVRTGLQHRSFEAGQLIRFCYRIVDPEKARAINHKTS